MTTKSLLAHGLLAVVSILIVSCGGGGDGGGKTTAPPMPPAPTALTYPAPPAFVVGQAIASLTPTVTGMVSSYTISPTLPIGVSIAATTGVISGTPTAVSAATPYTVTASNSTGSTTTTLTIVVNPAASAFSYPASYYAYSVNAAGQMIAPIITAGTAVSWSVRPALPVGLSLDTTSGAISGTPTVPSAAAQYTISATNAGGTATFAMTIAVGPAPLLDLGHAAQIAFVLFSGTRVLSDDVTGHWLLQDYATGATVADGDNSCAPSVCGNPNDRPYPPVLETGLGGSVMIDDISGGVEVRSATTGALLSTISGTFSWIQLAVDGSYVATGSTTGLTVWNTSGTAFITVSGDYSKAVPFCAAGQIQIAGGAAGNSVIQTISVPGGVASLSPTFQGTFSSWFKDGARFLSYLNGTVWTYSAAAVQQDLTQVTAPVGEYGPSGLNGEGNWFWTFDSIGSGTLNVYKVGASTSPTFTSTFSTDATAIASGTTLGILSSGAGQISVLDLSGATLTSASYMTPIARNTAYAATSAATWMVGNIWGVVLDGASLAAQPRYLTLGTAWSIAGGTSYFSIATASGAIYGYSAGTDALAVTLDFSSSQLAASSSGATLAALADSLDSQDEPDRTVNIYSLPGGTVSHSFPSTINSTPLLSGIALSGSGTVLGETFSSNAAGGCIALTVPVTGGANLWCDSAPYAGTDIQTDLQLSPDGTLVAETPNLGSAPLQQTLSASFASTNIFQNGTLVTTVPGVAAGWLDNARLLANTYVLVKYGANYAAANIYSPSGTILSNPPVPQLLAIIPITTDTVYAPPLNQIFSLSTGASTWASGNPFTGTGVVGGSQIVFASGHWVLAQPYTN